jgi:hypothetical protein
MRLFPWLASTATIVISYLKWTRGTLLVNAKTNVGDSVFPLLMGVAEFLLFAVLSVDKENSTLWLNWCGCLSLHAFIAVGIVHNRIKLIDKKDFAPDLNDLVSEYKSWLVADRWQAASIGLLACAVWIANLEWLIPKHEFRIGSYIQSVFALLFFIGSWKPISDANSQRNRIDQYVSAPAIEPVESEPKPKVRVTAA